MTKKVTPAAKAEKVWAPAPGTDPEFEENLSKVLEALTASGNPEGITPEAARETLAHRNTVFGGKTYNTQSYEVWPGDIGEDDEDERPVVELVIPTPSEAPYWYEEPEQARLIDHYIMTRRALGNLFHGALLIVGPAGSGKTMGVPQAVARLNAKHNLSMRMLKMDCPTITDPQKWFGRREVDAEGTHYIESDFIRGVREGNVVILLDELTRIHPTIGNVVHSLLDGSQALHLSELNITVPVAQTTVFLATANIGAQFGGTHRMDWALRERFAFTVARDFPPKEDEIRILTTHTGCDPDAASVLVNIAAKTRAMYATGDLRSPISTRTLVAAAWLVASGMTKREAMRYTAEPLYDADSNGMVGEKSERMQVRSIIELR